MADHLKPLKDAVWKAKTAVTAAEKQCTEWANQLAGIQQLMEGDPKNTALLTMKEEVEAQLAIYNSELAKTLETHAALEAQLPHAPEPAAPKFDPEKHPLLKKAVEKTEEAQPVVFKTGDICEAQWTDRAWYKAKIQTILGSASAPKYLVKFLEYQDTMTVDRDALRPLPSKRKREEAAPAAATPTPQAAPVTSTPHVISGPASVNPNPQGAKKDAPIAQPEPKKRKIPNQKHIEKGVNSWKNWNSKGVGKKIAQKESMFRSGTTVNSRVGFTGSGAGMSETHKRLRHDKKVDAEVDEEGFPGHSSADKRPRF